MTERLSIDIRRCLTDSGEVRGLTQESLDEWAPRLEAARQAVIGASGTGMMGFTELPFAEPSAFTAFAEQRRGTFDDLLVIGIGGSALGTIALSTALLPGRKDEVGPVDAGRPRLHVLDNIDPDETYGLLERLDPRRTLVNVISKSGTTAESMAGYLVVRERIESALGTEALSERLVFTTDPSEGILGGIGRHLGVPMFALPPGVGGRFSVLSSVGLLPAALCGMDVDGLLAGARDAAAWFDGTSGWENPAVAFAGIQFLEDTVFGRRVSVMMPYSARLRDMADWFRQLWAESLGKETDRQGRRVNVGPLPVKALGATDQHSQLQLYSEGPDDKVVTFLGVAEFDHEVPIPAPGPEAEPLAYLSGHSLAELLWAEQKATAWALAQKGRPSLTITLPRVDAFSVGALIYVLEMATAIAGDLYDVDAFDQPGVELAKRATNALMGRPGYEDLAARID